MEHSVILIFHIVCYLKYIEPGEPFIPKRIIIHQALYHIIPHTPQRFLVDRRIHVISLAAYLVCPASQKIYFFKIRIAALKTSFHISRIKTYIYDRINYFYILIQIAHCHLNIMHTMHTQRFNII